MPTLNDLRAAVPQLSTSDARFASDLIRAWAKYGSLTAKQQPWVSKLIERTQRPGLVQTPSVTIGDFSGVIALFHRAHQHLKYPKICLMVGNDPVILSMAGAASKAPGTINVMGEGQYPNRAWYGRVTPTGEWQPSQRANVDTIAPVLAQLASDPHGTAAAYGKLTGNCCFCQRELSDARSVTAGYGPVCADHYGLADQWANAVKVLDMPSGALQGTFAEVMA